MSGTVHPIFPAQKACSGKCSKGKCGRTVQKIWVIAACAGKVSLFEDCGGILHAIPSANGAVFPSLEVLRQTLHDACERGLFDQLVLVGSDNDAAWLHAALPEDAARRVVAEMQYPLLAGWFEEASVAQLSGALAQVLHP